MQIDLSERVVIVTGAGRGIGRAIAERAAGANARVVLAARSEDQLQAVADAIGQRGGQALAVPTDVTDEAAQKALVDATLERFGRIDALVNNAATNYIANLIMAKPDRIRALYDVNVFAVFTLTKAVLRHMIRAKSGRIINVSSVSAQVGAAYNTAYASSKAAIDGFTRSVAREVARIGITANAIAPWHVDTELVHEAMASRAKLFGKTAEAYLEDIVEHSPQRRLITADEVAGLAVFLMSDDARGINGQSLNVCGGTVM